MIRRSDPISRTHRERISVAVLSPHHEQGYSGPAILLERILHRASEALSVSVYGPGPRRGSTPQRVAYRQFRRSSKHSLRGRVLWMVNASRWALRSGPKYDVVHFHGTFIHELLPALFLLCRRVPYVLFPLTEAGDLRIDSRSGRVPGLNVLRRLLVSKASGAFSLAPSIRLELTHWGLAPELIVDLANPASPGCFAPLERPDPRFGLHVLGFVGKLTERKQPQLILHTLALLRSRGWSDARAMFVGPFADDDFRRDFERLADGLTLGSRVTVTGHIDDVTPVMLNELSVFLLPSRQEGLPGALTEALATGLPCGVSSAGSMPDIIAASGGGVVLPLESPAIADFVESLWCSEETWLRHSRGGREYAAAHLSPEAVSEGYVRALLGFARRA